MSSKSIYLIGSLRNPEVPNVGNALRAIGYDAFDDWFAAGPEADDYWQKYEKHRGRHYSEALTGHAARNVFEFDLRNLQRSYAGLLILPAGKSGHMEFGYLVGLGKPGFVLFPEEPERYDVMYQFAHLNGGTVFFSVDQMIEHFKKLDFADRQIIRHVHKGFPNASEGISSRPDPRLSARGGE